MDSDRRDAIRASNQRRAISCPRCGSTSVHELTADEKRRRDDVFEDLRYKTCGGCGHTWRLKGGK